MANPDDTIQFTVTLEQAHKILTLVQGRQVSHRESIDRLQKAPANPTYRTLIKKHEQAELYYMALNEQLRNQFDTQS